VTAGAADGTEGGDAAGATEASTVVAAGIETGAMLDGALAVVAAGAAAAGDGSDRCSAMPTSAATPRSATTPIPMAVLPPELVPGPVCPHDADVLGEVSCSVGSNAVADEGPPG